MDEELRQIQLERDRLAKRLARERSVRAQAERIAERAIRRLADTNQEHETFFNLSLNLFCTADSTLHFRELSPSWEQVLGWSLDELRERPFLDFVHPDDLESTERDASRLLAESGITVGFTNRYRHKKGHWVRLSWSVRVVHGIFYGEAIDISAQERAEAALRESQARSQAVLNSAVDAIVTIDQDGIIRDLNPATEKMFGYRLEKMAGRNVSMLMPSPHREHHDSYIARYLEGGDARVIGIGREIVARRADGSTFPIELTVSEIRLAERRLFTGIVRDISERKAALRRLEETMQELAHSRDDLLAILNQLRPGTLLIDSNDCISFVSEKLLAVTWAGTESVLGRRWDEVLPLDLRSRDALRTVMRTESSRRARLSVEWHNTDGTKRRVEIDLRDDPRDTAARIALVYDVTEIYEMRSRLAAASYGRMIGNCAPMRALYEKISQVAKGNWTVLVEGETGVGKELVARAIHAASDRQHGPFVAVNCAGLTDSLLESQLFGHRKGAFTGALTDQQGLFETANGGTIFLDEIGDVSPKLQGSLLRVLQEQEILRVGDSRPRPIDVRVVAATNKDLARESEVGRFRLDLLYRIRVARIFIPPLRQRGDDITMLAAAFLDEEKLSAGKPALQLDPSAVLALQRYSWPGNVRELRSAIQVAIIHCTTNLISVHDLPPEIVQVWQQPVTPDPVPPTTSRVASLLPDGAGPAAGTPASVTLPPWPAEAAPPAALESASEQRAQILAALEWAEGNRARAARRLGISRATLYRRLTELGIEAKRPST